MHRNKQNNIIIMKHAQRHTKQYNSHEYTNNIIIMHRNTLINNKETCIEIH